MTRPVFLRFEILSSYLHGLISNFYICQVVPIVTQLKESLSNISDEDVGVKTFKRKLLSRVEERISHFETMEIYALSCILDPRLD